MRQTIALALTGLAGLLLLGLSIPRIAASLAKAPSVAPSNAVHRGELVATEPLEAAIEGLRQSLAESPHAVVMRDLSLLELVLADRLSGSPVATELYRRGGAHAAESLARAPGRAHAWTRLAYAELALNGPSAKIGELVAISIETGEVIQELTFPRLGLLLRAWPNLEIAQRRLAGPLIRQAWRQNAVRLAQLAHRTGSTALTRLALSALPGAAKEFDRIVGREEKRGG